MPSDRRPLSQRGTQRPRGATNSAPSGWNSFLERAGIISSDGIAEIRESVITDSVPNEATPSTSEYLMADYGSLFGSDEAREASAGWGSIPSETRGSRGFTISSPSNHTSFENSRSYGLQRATEGDSHSVRSYQTESEIADPEGNPMRNTIGSLLGIPNPLQLAQTHPMIVGTELVGLEIELEHAPVMDMQYWNTTEDGSLRDGKEYVMKQPLGGESLRQAILEIDGRLEGQSVDPSWRCSTHGHFNFLNSTVPVLKRTILAYICFEPIIYTCSGYHRWNNIFCPAYGFAKEQLMLLASVWHLEGGEFLTALRGLGVKYSGFNLLPLFTQGSVEFRGSEPKYHKGQLFRLVNRFLSLKKFAEEWTGTDLEMIAYLQIASPSSILQKSFPPKFRIEQDLIDQSIINAYDVVSLGDFKRPNAETEVRTNNSETWRDFFGMDRPRTVSVGRLLELVNNYSPDNYRGHLDTWTDEDGEQHLESAPDSLEIRWFVDRSGFDVVSEYERSIRPTPHTPRASAARIFSQF